MVRIVITDMMTHWHTRRSLVVRHIIVRCVDVMRVSESRRTLHCALADGGGYIPPLAFELVHECFRRELKNIVRGTRMGSYKMEKVTTFEA